MAIIICPTIDKFVDVEMLNSKDFLAAKHRIRLLKISNYKTADDSDQYDYLLPKSICNGNRKKTSYREYQYRRSFIAFTLYDIEPKKGLETLNRWLKHNHGNDTKFYVVEMVTETISGKGKYAQLHHCKWERKSSAANNARIVSLQLTHIDSKNVLENFSETEMFNIVGKLQDSSCRLKTSVKNHVQILCTPVM